MGSNPVSITSQGQIPRGALKEEYFVGENCGETPQNPTARRVVRSGAKAQTKQPNRGREGTLGAAWVPGDYHSLKGRLVQVSRTLK